MVKFINIIVILGVKPYTAKKKIGGRGGGIHASFDVYCLISIRPPPPPPGVRPAKNNLLWR